MSDQTTTTERPHYHLPDPDAAPVGMSGPFPVVPCISCCGTRLTLVHPEMSVGDVLDQLARVGMRLQVVAIHEVAVTDEWDRGAG